MRLDQNQIWRVVTITSDGRKYIFAPKQPLGGRLIEVLGEVVLIGDSSLLHGPNKRFLFDRVSISEIVPTIGLIRELIEQGTRWKRDRHIIMKVVGNIFELEDVTTGERWPAGVTCM